MKIVHIAPCAPYNDYWGYQENILPKYQKKLGHDVTLIITNRTHKDGKIVEVEPADYVLNDGVRVIRLRRKKYIHRLISGLNSKLDVFGLLEQINPDFIFYHGLVSSTIYDVVKYKKKINPDCVIVQDNHMDYNIGYHGKSLRTYVLRAYYRHVRRKTISHVSKVYGVTPWRKDYVEDFFKVSPQITDVLIMGADDEKIDFANRASIRASKRTVHGIKDDDFLIVTGGKIDKKKKIDILMKACLEIKNVKLIVFGNVLDDVKQEFDSILKTSDNIIYIGWVDADKVYDYFFAADLVFFPGQHSVLWEQACACKVPCVFEKWDGMDHVNNGGNSDFIEPVTEETIRQKILELQYTDKYYSMKRVAESTATDVYLYSNIAKKSLECVNDR